MVRSAPWTALVLVALVQGCALVGSPVSALDGAGPYAWTALDVRAARGEASTPHFFSVPPWLGVVDLPFALVMDTAMLPIALPVSLWSSSDGEPRPSWFEELFAALELDEHPRVVAEVGEVRSWRQTDEAGSASPRREVLLVQGTRGECRVTVYWLTAASAQGLGLGAVEHEDGAVCATLRTEAGEVDLLAGRGLPASDRR